LAGEEDVVRIAIVLAFLLGCAQECDWDTDCPGREGFCASPVKGCRGPWVPACREHKCELVCDCNDPLNPDGGVK
jgi:hypothetical protein